MRDNARKSVRAATLLGLSAPVSISTKLIIVM